MSGYVLELRNAIKKATPLLHTTLDYFMADYVGHFKHHLRQVIELD